MGFVKFACLVLFSACASFAAVRPAGIFTDNAVLQQGKEVCIWGTAAPGEAVTVLFAGQRVETVAGNTGKWTAVLGKMTACAEGRSLIIQGSETVQPVELKNILVGEVWLAGGQSNMVAQMRVFRQKTQLDIDAANDALLRMATIPRKDFEGQNNARAVWKPASPQSVAGFSAAAYYFAKNLREDLGVPVGVVCCAASGTPAETWMSQTTLSSRPDLKRTLDAYETGFRKRFTGEDAYRQCVKEYGQAMDEWTSKKEAGEKPNPRPEEPMGPLNKNRPGGLHETMLMQVIPYTIQGVIWYQGENNASASAGFHYRSVFSALIQEWRNEFKNPNMPFLFVQLATFGPASDSSPSWPELRESQKWTEDHVANTGMIVLVDGGEENNVHPASKDKAGYRLSLLARHLVYGEKDVVCRGPRLAKKSLVAGAIEMTFTDTGSGLELKDGSSGVFEVCGCNGVFVHAEARVSGNRIVVSAEDVPEPKDVRYGWRKWFVPTLFNKEGLPASPFRTDDFFTQTKDRYYLDQWSKKF